MVVEPPYAWPDAGVPSFAKKLEKSHPQGVTAFSKLPEPRITMPDSLVQISQNLSYIGELRQRWEEIKRLQVNPLTT